MRECPQCQAVFMAAYRSCPDCGFEMPRNEITLHHGTHAASDGILSTETSETEYEVRGTHYQTHEKRNAPPGTPRTLRIDYLIGFSDFQSQWVCPEHTGYARKKFIRWWQERTSLPVPETAREAAAIGNQGLLREPRKIRIRTTPGNKFPEIVRFELADKTRAEEQEEAEAMAANEPAEEDLSGNVLELITEADAEKYVEEATAGIRKEAELSGSWIDLDAEPDDIEERLAMIEEQG